MISIIIPVYNEQDSIANCLKSLLAQSLPPAEIIVVDDGSTDKTLSIIKQFPVKVLTQKHKGPGPARNLAAKASQGQILVFVDADMSFDKNFLKHLVKPIVAKKTFGTFNIKEIVSNWNNPLARCWSYNQNLAGKNRLNPNSIHDIQDFRAITKGEFARVGGFSSTGDYTDSRSLAAKLGYTPTPVKDAISFHKNPSSIAEVFTSAAWIGKRPTKLGIIGKAINLLRYSLPVSLIIATIKAARYREPYLFIFKPVYDLGFSWGVLLSLFSKNLAK